MKIIHLLKIAFGCLILLISSCRKEYTTNVNGVVRNKITGEGVEGIPVEILGCSFSGSSYKCLELINRTVTDQNGRYAMSVESSKWKQFKIKIRTNNIWAYFQEDDQDLVTGSNNTIDFSLYPIKKLKAHVTVQRHNRNWLVLGIENAVQYNNFWAYLLYDDSNPINDFDSTFIFNIVAGRQYQMKAILSDQTAPNTYINHESFYKPFTVDNVDTTLIDFIVQ
jgi:hypothetical protein